jgi:hypothetical protein
MDPKEVDATLGDDILDLLVIRGILVGVAETMPRKLEEGPIDAEAPTFRFWEVTEGDPAMVDRLVLLVCSAVCVTERTRPLSGLESAWTSDKTFDEDEVRMRDGPPPVNDLPFKLPTRSTVVGASSFICIGGSALDDFGGESRAFESVCRGYQGNN